MDLVPYVAEPRSVPRIGGSPPSWMCEAVLAAKRLAFRRVALSFERGEHKTDAMLAINPRGTIPVLTDGDAVLSETFAILLHAERLSPGHLPDARALNRFFEAEHLKAAGMKALGSLMRTGDFGDTTELRAELGRWEGAMADEFVSGSTLTLADFVVHGYVATLHRLGMNLDAWPRLDAHRRRLSGRLGGPGSEG